MESSGGGGIVPSRDFSKYLPLYNAAVSDDWKTANTLFFEKNIDQTEAIISYHGETVLHVAVQSGRANDFVRKLVALMSPEALALKDRYGYTALHEAAKVGNTEAAMIMLEKNPDLQYMLCHEGRLPVTTAAVYSQKDTLVYLISVSKPKVENTPFEGNLGLALLIEIIGCEFLDVALDLVKKYPDLARLKLDNRCALSFMAEMENVFQSRQTLTWWEKLIYRGAPLKQHESGLKYFAGDNEAQTYTRSSSYGSVGKQFKPMIWKAMKQLVPRVKHIKDKKEIHKQAKELAKYLCQGMKSLPEKDAWIMFQDSIFKAAEHGISEIIEVIMEMYPVITGSVDSKGRSIMHLAACNRFENVFNLTYSMSDRKHLFSNSVDFEGNNLMHMCARLAPTDKLNLVSGAALQMQRELQWFNVSSKLLGNIIGVVTSICLRFLPLTATSIILQEMQRFVPPSRRKWANNDGTTPKKLFTEQHQELKAQGEKWMKDTANACSITTALIATVVFAASFTLPGGVSEDGKPILNTDFAFVFFAITNAVSLFTSITSLMLFLSILTSRYAEEDFLYVLPKRLSFGLLTLFISVTFMLIAFSSALNIVLRFDTKWFIGPMIVCGVFPVASFVLLQFPLLFDVFCSTYFPRIFRKKTGRLLF